MIERYSLKVQRQIQMSFLANLSVVGGIHGGPMVRTLLFHCKEA